MKWPKTADRAANRDALERGEVHHIKGGSSSGAVPISPVES
jgi:hypothetical protein